MSMVEQLLREGFSLIPLKDGKPAIKWKKYQTEKATIKEIFGWFQKFGDIDLGIVTGNISHLAVIVVNDEKQLPALEKKIPNLWATCRVRTPELGYHFYYELSDGNEVRSCKKLFGLKGVELKGFGSFVVAPEGY
ncbi:hypothetical protein ES705_48067 [subsurface metagenome]